MSCATGTSVIKFVALFTFVIIIFNTCKKKEPELTPQPASNVIVLSDSTELNNITSYDDTTGQITFSNPVDYSIDYIIVSEPSTAAPDGFLRRITGIESDKKTLMTEQATLEDAVINGYLAFQKQITSSDLRLGSGRFLNGVRLLEPSAFDFSFQLTNVILYDVDGDTNTTNDQILANGYINFNTAFNGILDIQGRKLVYFLFQNSVTDDSKIDIDAKISANINEEKTIWKHKLPAFVIGVIPTPIPIPVVVTPIIVVNVGLNGSISLNTTMGITQTATLTGGISYENSQWNIIKTFTNSFSFTPPQLSSEMNFRGYAGPQLNLLLYGVAGPYAEVDVFGRLTATASPGLTWILYGGLEVLVGAKIKALGKTLVDFSATVIKDSTIIAQGSGGGSPPVADFTANTTTITAGGIVNFTDLSTNTPTSRAWDFGDGGAATLQNPTHTYSTTGTYTVSLTATNAYGSDTKIKNSYITVLPL